MISTFSQRRWGLYTVFSTYFKHTQPLAPFNASLVLLSKGYRLCNSVNSLRLFKVVCIIPTLDRTCLVFHIPQLTHMFLLLLEDKLEQSRKKNKQKPHQNLSYLGSEINLHSWLSSLLRDIVCLSLFHCSYTSQGTNPTAPF